MFKSWCTSQRFTNGSNISHVRMDGGVLSVPFDRLNEFHERYVNAVERGEELFLVEQKTPTYNFFVDIDYKDDVSLNMDEIKDICKVICDKVKRHGGKDCLISVSPPKKCGSLIKTGVHLNWHGLVVDQSSAIALREHILVALSKAKGSLDWNEIIDAAVYGDAQRGTKGSGFRMIWSHKMGRGEKGERVVQRAYLPLFIYKWGPLSTILAVDQKPNLDILKMSVVRTDAPQSHVIQSPSNVIKEGSFTAEQTKDEIRDDELKSLTERFVQDNMEGQGGASITKIFKHNNLFLVSTNSKYCENLKRGHSSNHVWFIVSGRHILQKCFCRCETIRGRRDGFCKDFCGRRHELSPRLVEMFYPKVEEIQKCKEIKKFVEKPKFKHTDTAKDIQKFIQTFLKNQGDTVVSKVQKQNNTFSVLTTSHYCEKIQGIHDENTVMSYVIKKRKELSQRCPLCKSTKHDRKYELTPIIVSKLFPKGT
jgi:hypothetical protein